MLTEASKSLSSLSLQSQGEEKPHVFQGHPHIPLSWKPSKGIVRTYLKNLKTKPQERKNYESVKYKEATNLQMTDRV